MIKIIGILKLMILGGLISSFLFVNNAFAQEMKYSVKVTVNVDNQSSMKGLTYILQDGKNNYFKKSFSKTYKSDDDPSNKLTLLVLKNGTNVLKILKKQNACMRDFSYSINQPGLGKYAINLSIRPSPNEFCKKFKIDMTPANNIYEKKCDSDYKPGVAKGKRKVNCDITINATIKNS